MNLSSTPAWHGEKVQLFLLEVSDVTETYVGWLNDPRVNLYLESRFQHHTLESTRTFVASCRADENVLFLGLRYPPFEGRHVGNIKLDINRRHGLGEVGILIGERAVHGRGVATDAIKLMSNIARTQLGLRKLSAGCYATNKGSERAFVKAGFVVEGVRPKHVLVGDRSEDVVQLGVLL